jgi:hypothetical protein
MVAEPVAVCVMSTIQQNGTLQPSAVKHSQTGSEITLGKPGPAAKLMCFVFVFNTGTRKAHYIKLDKTANESTELIILIKDE